MYIISLGTTIYFLGFFLSVSPLCIFVDKYGRRSTSILFFGLSAISSMLMWISNSVEQILVVRFLFGALHGGMSIATCVAMSELTSPKYATLFMMLSSAGFSMGGGVVGLVSKWCDEWQLTMIPPLLSFSLCAALFWYFIPETPYWLFARGREADAINALNTVAYYNKRPPLKNIEVVSSSGEVITAKKSQSWSIVFNTNILRTSIAFLSFNWFTVSICYYGLEFNAGTLGDEYVVMMLMGCFDTPFKIALFYFAEKFGRKISIQSYLAACLSCLILSGFGILDTITIYGKFTIKTLLVVTGRSFGGSCFALFYIYTAEILPTLVRSLGISICSTSARVGSLLAPTVILVNEISPSIIYVFIVICLLLSIYVLRNIPETLGRPLPNSIKDCERLFENKPVSFSDKGILGEET